MPHRLSHCSHSAPCSRDRGRRQGRRHRPILRRSDVPQIVFYKLIMHPALVLGTGRLAIAAGAPLDGFAATVLALVAALPSASNVPMLAERFGADAGRIARIVLVTTGLAFLSFSAAVALLV